MLWEWRREVSKFKAQERWLEPLWKPQGKIGWALVYPNYYSVGISNLGFLMVYRMLAEMKDIFVSRFFKWDGFTPLSFEEGRSLQEFEVIAFSLSYELDLINLISILKKAGIPPLRGDRVDRFPVVGVGGIFPTMNPRPLFPIADFIFCGESEESLSEMAEVFLSCWGLSKDKVLERLADLDGVLVPGVKDITRRRWVMNLDRYALSAPLYTPLNQFGGALLIELNRGCKRGCLFCPVRQCYNPFRFRSFEGLKSFLEEIPRGVKVGLISPVATDYPFFDELLDYLLETGRKVSFGSFRVEGISEKLLLLLKQSDQKLLTLAPETANEDLRRRIGKAFSNDLLKEKISLAYRYGFRRVKLYFMVGLPGESLKDVEEINSLVREIKSEFKGLEVIVSVNPFVPKPFTPFEGESFLSIPELVNRLKIIRKIAGVDVRGEGIKKAWLEAIISRGDEKLGETLSILGDGAFSPKVLEEHLDVKIYLSGEIKPWRESLKS